MGEVISQAGTSSSTKADENRRRWQRFRSRTHLHPVKTLTKICHAAVRKTKRRSCQRVRGLRCPVDRCRKDGGRFQKVIQTARPIALKGERASIEKGT